MQQMSSASADTTPPTSDRRGVVAGLLAGVVALGCCVGPAVAALIGVTSAAVAIDVATDLYNEWGWAFKLAGLAFAGVAVGITVTQSRSCSTQKPRLRRFVAILGVSAIATYGVLYGATTWLGRQATLPAPAIVAEGDSIDEQVFSAIEQTRQRYPDTLVDLEALSSTGIRVRIGWAAPEVADALTDRYNEEVTRRVGDSREATIVLLQAIARAAPEMKDFAAYEDLFFIPIWSRNQILDADPVELRDYEGYGSFVFSAEDQAGYSILFKGDEK